MNRFPFYPLRLAVVASVLFGLTFLATGRSLIERAVAQEPAQFGPQLFLLTVPAGQAPIDLPAGVNLHAQINHPTAQQFVASGPAADREALATAGYTVDLLDADTRGSVYYFVDAQAADARAQAQRVGAILYANPEMLLVGTSTANERTLVERLPAQAIPISLLSPEPLVLKAPSVEAIRLRTAATPDPLIESLLPHLTTADLADQIGKLSGEEPVEVDGSSLTLDTRYTFAVRIRDAERYLHQHYTNMGLDVGYYNWTYGNYSGRDVIAEIPGIQHPERIWVVGGHFDDISEIPYSRAPGADDNASGTAATLLIADILRAYQFADTIRFVHFSGEEQGQWGSKRYARELNLAGEQVMGYIDLDMIGWDGNSDDVLELHPGTDSASNAVATAFIDAAQRYGQDLNFERKTTTASRFSDHSAFWDYGYPAFLVIENFFTDDIPPDRNPWYHSSGDRLERVDLDYVARIGRTALATVAELAGIQSEDVTPVPTATPTTTPTLTATPTPTPSPTPLPTGCQNLLGNGGFEERTELVWKLNGAYLPVVVDTPRHTGSYALQMGLPSAVANRRSYSTAYQSAMIPTWPEEVLLTYWQRPGNTADGNDYREISLLNSNLSYLKILEQDRVPGDDQWQQRSFDLTNYRGQTVVVYFNTYNNGSGSQMWNYVDDVALLVCSGAEATATPTPTATLTPTVTPTATATATPTPAHMLQLPLILKEPAATPTPTETPTPTATLSPTATSGSPLPTPTPSPTVAEP